MTKRKLTKTRKSFALRPSRNRETRLGLAEGDAVHRGDGADRLLPDPCDAGFARRIEAGESILGRYGDAFRELAK